MMRMLNMTSKEKHVKACFFLIIFLRNAYYIYRMKGAYDK